MKKLMRRCINCHGDLKGEQVMCPTCSVDQVVNREAREFHLAITSAVLKQFNDCRDPNTKYKLYLLIERIGEMDAYTRRFAIK